MIKKIIHPAIVLLLAASTNAFADDHASSTSDMISNMNNLPPWSLILGAQAGYGYLSANDYPGAEKEKGGPIGGIFIGLDYNIIPQLSIGLELGVNYGFKLLKFSNNVNQSAETKDTYIVPLLATLKYTTPIGINLFVKAGGAYVHQKGTENGIDLFGSSQIANAARVALAGGIGYMWHNWNFFAQYMYTFGDKDAATSSNENSTFPVNSITGGISYTFPLNF